MVQITAVPSVAVMIGVSRILRGQSVTAVLGNTKLGASTEKALRKRYIQRSLELLQGEGKKGTVFTLEGVE